MGIDATRKTPPETHRDWGRVATMDQATRDRIESLARSLGL